MKKILLSILLLLLTGSVFAQPMFYNDYSSSFGNQFPLGQTNGKFVNWLFEPGVFNKPYPCPPGYEISKIYIRMYGGGSRVYDGLCMLMAQTTNTNLTSGQFYPGPWDTVFFKDTTLTSPGANQWMPIQLHTKYPYDPTKSLVVGIGQCGGIGSGMYVRQTNLSGTYRIWSVGGCPFVPYNGGDHRNLCMGFDIQPSSSLPGPIPDIIYYNFELNPSSRTVRNYAIPGQGLSPGILTGSTALTLGGQFDSCILGDGVSGGGVNARWNCNLGSGSWTISMWINIPTEPPGSAQYLFGDAGSNSFRCYTNGNALPNNLSLSGTFNQVLVYGIGPAPTVVHFVYDSASHAIRTYKNGVYNNIFNVNPLNLPTGSGFRVGGYSTSPTMKGRMDEFRVYGRALNSTEIALTWNHELPLVTGIPTPVLNMPDEFLLSQNYPNPFNPTTTIKFSIPQNGLVKLVVFDVLGKEVATLVNEVKNAGSYTVDFNGSNLPSGTYIYRLEAGDNLDVKKMILLK